MEGWIPKPSIRRKQRKGIGFAKFKPMGMAVTLTKIVSTDVISKG